MRRELAPGGVSRSRGNRIDSRGGGAPRHGGAAAGAPLDFKGTRTFMMAECSNPPVPSRARFPEMAKTPTHNRPREWYDTGTEALRGVSLEIGSGEFFFRPARAQRRLGVRPSSTARPVSPARPAARSGYSATMPSTTTSRPARVPRPGAPGHQPRLVPDRRGDARLPRWLFRHEQKEDPQGARG